MALRLEQVDAELIEAIARRVADLISDANLRRGLGEPHAEGVIDPQEEMLTPDEAASMMRHSAKSVRKLCRLPKGDPRHLRHLRKGPKILIRRSDIAEWIARQIGED